MIDKLSIYDNALAATIFCIALMLLVGFAMTRITKLLKLPNVTAYLVAGILLGPYCLNAIPESIIKGMDFLPDVCLAFVAFCTGNYFNFKEIKSSIGKNVVITVIQSVIVGALVFLVTYFVLQKELGFSLVLASIATTVSPTSTVMTIRQTKAKGEFVNTLIQVIAISNLIGLLLFSIVVSAVSSVNAGAAFNAMSVIKPIAFNLLAFVIGGVFGVLLKLLMPDRRTNDNRLIIVIAVLFTFCAICHLMDVSPFLGCIAMGTIYYNLVKDDRLIKQLNYFSPPILLLFFVRSGANLELADLFSSLILVVVVYVVIRSVGMWIGSFAGSSAMKKGKNISFNLGLGLLCQSSVAIGLAAVACRSIGGTMGAQLQTVIIGTSILFELIGPVLAKLSLSLSKSISNDLEDLTKVNPVTDTGEQRNEVELLIERIKQIQETIPEHEETENEAAFTEAAEEQYYAMVQNRRRRRL